MNRRDFLKAAGLIPLGVTGCQYLPVEGFYNPCHQNQLPKHLREHDLVLESWQGIDTSQVWDVHTHLIGIGDSQPGLWVNPRMKSIFNLIQYIQYKFYMDGSCINQSGS